MTTPATNGRVVPWQRAGGERGQRGRGGGQRAAAHSRCLLFGEPPGGQRVPRPPGRRLADHPGAPAAHQVELLLELAQILSAPLVTSTSAHALLSRVDGRFRTSAPRRRKRHEGRCGGFQQSHYITWTPGAQAVHAADSTASALLTRPASVVCRAGTHSTSTTGLAQRKTEIETEGP